MLSIAPLSAFSPTNAPARMKPAAEGQWRGQGRAQRWGKPQGQRSGGHAPLPSPPPQAAQQRTDVHAVPAHKRLQGGRGQGVRAPACQRPASAAAMARPLARDPSSRRSPGRRCLGASSCPLRVLDARGLVPPDAARARLPDLQRPREASSQNLGLWERRAALQPAVQCRYRSRTACPLLGAPPARCSPANCRLSEAYRSL